MLLIGSKAYILRVDDPQRQPRDIDVIATFDELSELTKAIRKNHSVSSIPLSKNKTVLKVDDGRIIEVEIAWTGSSGSMLLQAAKPHIDLDIYRASVPGLPIDAYIPTLDMLFSLKLSHRYLKNSPHFRKTRADILRMRSVGAKVWDHTWLRQREEETYYYKHPKLNVEKKDFFRGDGVQYVYDHDDIHNAMAHVILAKGDDLALWKKVPAYTLYMKDGEEVKSDKVKFFAAKHQVRLYGVLEEAQVLALERSQIPFRDKVDPRRSFDIALEKVATSITSGWFREFAWENLDAVEALYEPHYVQRFWKAVEDGTVRKLDTDETGTY